MTKPIIVLVAPQMGENIGACARAMLNCGLNELRIVNPRDGWPSERAQAMASGAFEKMLPVQVFDTTADALKDCHYTYATTARPRDMVKPVMTAKDAAIDVHARTSRDQKLAYLFGGERAGLSNEDVALSHSIITIPMNPDFSSLNLAQGVLLCAYEWYQESIISCLQELNHSPLPSPMGRGGLKSSILEENLGERLSTHAELNNLFIRLEEELRNRGFFRTQEMQPAVMRNLKNMLSRAEMTEQEVNTFHGMITTLIGRKGEVKKPPATGQAVFE